MWPTRRRPASRATGGATPSSRGFTVALIGPDGAGKTTVVDAACRSVSLPSRCLYMGTSGRRLPWLVHLPSEWVHAPVLLLLLCGTWLVGQWLRSRGYVVFFDRYSYDALITPSRHLPRVDRWMRWLRGHALPAPDLTVMLDAPGSVLYARSHEYSPTILETERQEYLALARHVPRFVSIDSNRPHDLVVRDLLAVIGERFPAAMEAEGR